MPQRHCYALLLPLLAVATTQAGDFQPLDSIERVAVQAVASGGQVQAHVDPTMRLPRCPADLQARVRSRNVVDVQCPQGWQIFVPVQVRRSQRVLVLTREVAPGQSILADAVALETRDGNRVGGDALTDPAQAVGQVARRLLSAGSVLGANALLSPRLVRRGDQVALVARRGGIEVRMAGKALADAGQNERVTVENLSSRRMVQGVVGAAGEVWIGP